MIKGTLEELDGIAKNYVCKDDGGALVVAWHAGENSYVLRCGKGHFPEEVTRQPSLTQLHKQGVELSEPIKSNVQKSIAKRAQRLPQAAQAETFTGVPATDLGTGELLKLEMVNALVNYAHKYQLDPDRGHVCLMYSKPYITIDGYLYHANKSKKPYTLDSRPIKQEEFGVFQIPEGAHAWLSTVTFTDTKAYFTGLGIVTLEEMTEMSKGKPGQLRSPVVARHPWQLAQKRADWQALRRAFPIGESEEKEIPPQAPS